MLSLRPAKTGIEASLAARVNTLWLGFAALLLLMAFVAFDANHTIQTLESSSTALRRQAHDRGALLDRLREGLNRSGTLARDYLLEPDPNRATLWAEMEQLRIRSSQALGDYEKLLPADEQTTFRALKIDTQIYWRSLDPILNGQPVQPQARPQVERQAQRQEKMDTYLLNVVLPRRGQAASLARQVAELNARDLDQAEQRLQSLQSGFRKRVMLVSTIAILVGLGVAFVSIRRMKHLEVEAESRYQEAAETKLELRRLADRLVVTQEEERRNISRELHDEVGQSMSAMLVDLGSVESRLPPDSLDRKQLAAARELAETSVRSIRDIALLLRPSMLDDLGLTPALNWQAREVNRRTGLRVKMEADDVGDDLSDDYRTCIYRVVQEALHNCAKYAKATQVRVVVQRNANGLAVSIQDDGIGFDPNRDKGAGLLGMEERVRVLGGRFRIDSFQSAGTLLSIQLPRKVPAPAPPTLTEQPV